MKRALQLIVLLLAPLMLQAQRPRYDKMSGMVRRIACTMTAATRAASPAVSQLCAFVRAEGHGHSVLSRYGCRVLARFGDIYIASIPVGSLAALSADNSVRRIEAGRSCSVTLDSMALHINAQPAYTGAQLPQAYTGEGVVIGVEDIGFDLTHPTFYSRDLSRYRIAALSDQLSGDSTDLYVGAGYQGRESLLALGHSRDGLDQTHGTHTAGIAAGSGYDSPYRGVAFDSELCLVANATTENAALIDSAKLYMYTYATDALGFKYIFDYARKVGKPCIISFSEGSPQDFHGDDQLFYQVLDSLTGPGRIIVASAGNNGQSPFYLCKTPGTPYKGFYLKPYKGSASFTVKTDLAAVISLGSGTGSASLSTQAITASPDSLLNDTLSGVGIVNALAYPSCYDHNQLCVDITITRTQADTLSVKVSAPAAHVECYCLGGYIMSCGEDSLMNSANSTHTILSPGSAPSVICVGATSYRRDIFTFNGLHRVYDQGHDGQLAPYSSTGPTYDGRVKPDVTAPGTNIISAYSSFYEEQHANAWDVNYSDKEHFDFRGRTYAWNYNSGTSMSTPAVAGAVALWLQARPTLTPTEVLDVIAHTSSHQDQARHYPNNLCGYGQIDAYRGLLYLLGLSKVKGLSTQQPTAMHIWVEGNRRLRLKAGQPLTHNATVAVYALNGKRVAMATLHKGLTEHAVDLSRLPCAVYAVQVNTADKATSGSTLVRLR